MSINSALVKAAQRLQNCERPGLEARLLLGHYLGLSQEALYLKEDMEFDQQGFFALVDKRSKDIPLEYITNSVSFYDTHLFVKQGVLIPRPETELLVEKCDRLIQDRGISQIAEIGTGSGAVSTCLAAHNPGLRITATDINMLALEVAKRNLQSHGVSERVRLVHTSLLEGIQQDFEMIVSNPPYIAQEYKLPANVAYEPEEALFSGSDGLELLKEIIVLFAHSSARVLACETGHDQKEALIKLLENVNIKKYEFYKDYAGLQRGFFAYKE
ncbi:MAG: peptide chain release factor N(5)-glutamine methyltransferase [Campylobacterota bacterium]